jgi:shikimate dehydrogenase
MSINAKTKIISLIGYPVEHSLSPVMHNAAIEYLGLNYCYVALPVAPGELRSAVNGIRSLHFAGFNVTIPYKQEVIPLLESVDEEARFIGAVNTVKNTDGFLQGYNTDGRGFMESIREAGIDTQGKDIFICGAGGAARAIGYYLSQTASKTYVFDIDEKKRFLLVEDLSGLNGNVIIAEDTQKVAHADIIINATPLGLRKDDPIPFDLNLLRNSQIVCDLIYWDTPLIEKAMERGCKTLNGLGMLLWQGVLAFQIWTGMIPPVDLMREVLVSGLNKG